MMRRHKRSTLFVLAASVMLSGPSCRAVADPAGRTVGVDGSGSEAELRQRWARWQSNDVRSYGFNLERDCFCDSETVTPARVDVRDGRVVSVRALTTGQPLSTRFVPTIDSLFQWAIREAEADGHVEVTYDPLLSYPARLVIGTLHNDAGTAYHVADLVPRI